MVTFTYNLDTLTQNFTCKWSALVVDKKHTIHFLDKTARKMKISIMVRSGYLILSPSHGDHHFYICSMKPCYEHKWSCSCSSRAGFRVKTWAQVTLQPPQHQKGTQPTVWGAVRFVSTQNSEQAVDAEYLTTEKYVPKESLEVQQHSNLKFKLILRCSQEDIRDIQKALYFISTVKPHLFIAEPLCR